MHERLIEDQRMLDAGDELDPEIPQTPVISVDRGQGPSLDCGVCEDQIMVWFGHFLFSRSQK